jgi:DNA-binding transcriptional LysR family regulator
MALNEIKLMEAAIALAEELNFSRAAQKLHISQPALTKRIAELEDRLGLALFERDRQIVDVNDSGRAFVEEARLSVLHGERAFQAAQTVARGVDVVLTIGRSPYTDPFLVSTLLSIQLPLFPRLRVERARTTNHTVDEALKIGRSVSGDPCCGSELGDALDGGVGEAGQDVGEVVAYRNV